MRTFAILLLLTSAVFAQTSPSMTPTDQALSERLLQEINLNIQLRVQLLAAQARIKELESNLNKPDGSTPK